MKTLTAPELAAWLADPDRPPPIVLDVREPWEVAHARLADAALPGGAATALFVPMGQIPASLERLDASRTTVCLCHHGARSMQVAMFLEHHGFADVYNLTGGIHAWSTQVDPSVAIY